MIFCCRMIEFIVSQAWRVKISEIRGESTYSKWQFVEIMNEPFWFNGTCKVLFAIKPVHIKYLALMVLVSRITDPFLIQLGSVCSPNLGRREFEPRLPAARWWIRRKGPGGPFSWGRNVRTCGCETEKTANRRWLLLRIIVTQHSSIID